MEYTEAKDNLADEKDTTSSLFEEAYESMFVEGSSEIPSPEWYPTIPVLPSTFHERFQQIGNQARATPSPPHADEIEDVILFTRYPQDKEEVKISNSIEFVGDQKPEHAPEHAPVQVHDIRTTLREHITDGLELFPPGVRRDLLDYREKHGSSISTSETQEPFYVNIAHAREVQGTTLVRLALCMSFDAFRSAVWRVIRKERHDSDPEWTEDDVRCTRMLSFEVQWHAYAADYESVSREYQPPCTPVTPSTLIWVMLAFRLKQGWHRLLFEDATDRLPLRDSAYHGAGPMTDVVPTIQGKVEEPAGFQNDEFVNAIASLPWPVMGFPMDGTLIQKRKVRTVTEPKPTADTSLSK